MQRRRAVQVNWVSTHWRRPAQLCRWHLSLLPRWKTTHGRRAVHLWGRPAHTCNWWVHLEIHRRRVTHTRPLSMRSMRPLFFLFPMTMRSIRSGFAAVRALIQNQVFQFGIQACMPLLFRPLFLRRPGAKRVVPGQVLRRCRRGQDAFSFSFSFSCCALLTSSHMTRSANLTLQSLLRVGRPRHLILRRSLCTGMLVFWLRPALSVTTISFVV